MYQASFGPGQMWAERTDATGSGIGPRQIGLMQDVDVTFSYTNKEVYGQDQFPALIARGQGKIVGKAKFVAINALFASDIFFGLTSQSGQFGVSQNEPATIPQTPPYSLQVANAITFNDDLGVAYANGDRFNRVTTPSNPGEYTVNPGNGVYTFAATDAGQAVRISYSYNIVTPGREIIITQQVQGFTPYFKATLFQKVSPGAPGTGGQNLPFALRLNACHSNSLSFPMAQDAFTMQGFDFNAFSDPNGIIGYWSAVKQ